MESCRHLTENHFIMPEEIQGIEHHISKLAFKLQQERRDHPRAVLSEQDHMEALTSDSMKQMKSHDDLVKHVEETSYLTLNA
jgi:hypothetical protein